MMTFVMFPCSLSRKHRPGHRFRNIPIPDVPSKYKKKYPFITN